MKIDLLVFGPIGFWAASFAHCCFAQVPGPTAEIRGTIYDQSGGALARASVQVQDLRTGVVRTTATDDAGEYSAAVLPLASYSVQVEVRNFQTAKSSPVTLSDGETFTLDFHLQVALQGMYFPKNPLFGHNTWEFDAFLGGGTGTGKSSNTQLVLAGGTVERNVTREIAVGNWYGGNLQYGAGFVPIQAAFTPLRSVYGIEIKPVVVHWNFGWDDRRRLTPYARFAEAVLFTMSTLPPSAGSRVHWSPEAGGGIHWFRRLDESVDFGIDIAHVPNTGIGSTSSGYSVSAVVTIGYSWYKHPTIVLLKKYSEGTFSAD